MFYTFWCKPILGQDNNVINQNQKDSDTNSIKLSRFEWDIFLSEVNTLKSDILKKPAFSQKEEILKGNFAKYLWRAQAIVEHKSKSGQPNREIVLELVFDATDSKKKGILYTPIFYNEIAYIISKNNDTKTRSNHERANL